jgi:hypothetical protein
MDSLRVAVSLLLALMSTMACAQLQTVEITEPGVYNVSELFKQADIVAVVKVLSGDTENYEHAVYKGEVIKGFKGVPNGVTVYFGPFVGEKLGWEYLLFLRNAGGLADPFPPVFLSLSPNEVAAPSAVFGGCATRNFNTMFIRHSLCP